MPLKYFQSDRNLTLAQACDKLSINADDVVSAEQVHGNKSAFVTKNELGQRIPGVDALITSEKKVPLVIRTADCAPILIHDQKKNILALVHAGRKGTELEITAKTIEKMGSDPKDLKVTIGPCIDKCCYPTDIRKLNLEQLAKVGVPEENIEVNSDCTCCNKDKYYSYRGDGPETGRMFLIACLFNNK